MHLMPLFFVESPLFAEEGVPAAGESATSTEAEGNQGTSRSTQMDALEARLLGEIPTTTSMEINGGPSELTGLFWVFPLFFAMVGLIVWSRFRKEAPLNPGEIRVLSKTPLGKEGAIAIVQVGETDGTSQKMLIGLSEQGAPRLLSVLDAQWSGREASPVPAVATGDFDQFLSGVSQTSSVAMSNRAGVNASKPSTVVEDPSLENRNDLVQELLQARGVRAYQMNVGLEEDGSEERSVPVQSERKRNSTLFEEEDSVAEDDPWVLNFRRKYQQS